MSKYLKITGLVILVLIILLIIFQFISYSPLKKKFEKDVEKEKKEISSRTIKFIEEDISKYPVALQRYLKENGFINKDINTMLYMEYEDVKFRMDKGKEAIKIDYYQFNNAENMDRLAFIDTKMHGMSFQGYDSYILNKGSMKGVLFKIISLFNQMGPDMDKGCLVTVLSESLLNPATIKKGEIEFKEIDNNHFSASLRKNGIEVTGVFTINDFGEMTEFYSEDRPNVTSDGKTRYIPWKIICNGYKLGDDGIKRPHNLKAIWIFDDGEFVYFDSDNVEYKQAL